MKIVLLNNAEEIRKQFMQHFVLSWEEFQVKQKDWISEIAARDDVIALEWYSNAYMWDRIDPAFPSVPLKDALAFLREKNQKVLFMSEKSVPYAQHHLLFEGEKHYGFVAQASSTELAALIEEEWYEDYILGMQNMYNPHPVLPVDLYVFDTSMTWCVVFTHETTDWESEIDDPLKAADSRLCILCNV